jgi:hypothetical protein
MDDEEFKRIAELKRNIAASIDDAKRIAVEAKHAPSPKPYRAPPGPSPSLGTMARQEAGWLWLTCPAHGCHHRTAAHLAIFVQMLGADCTMDDFRARLWCTKCGRLDCSTMAQSWLGSQEATNAFPQDQSYYAHLEKLDREGAFAHVVVDRRTGTIRRDRLTAAQARNAAFRYSARGRQFDAMHFDRWRMVIAQKWGKSCWVNSY